MNQPLIDNAILAIAFITALLMVTLNGKRKINGIRAFLLLFAPLIIFYNMWGHSVAVANINYQRYVSGAFHAGSHFYTVVALGLVFIFISGLNIHFAKKIINGKNSVSSKIHILNLITSLSFAWFISVNPIALLPVICSVVSSSTLFFTILKSKKGNDLVLQESK